MSEVQSYKIPNVDIEVLEALREKGFYMDNNHGPFEKWEDSNKTLTHVDYEFSQGKIIHYIFGQISVGKKPVGGLLSKEEVISIIKGL